MDADVARDALAARLEQALALPVELGAAELSLLPRPALRVHDVRIGADGGPRVVASLLRVELSPLALLRGHVVPRGDFALRGATLDVGALRLEEIGGRGVFEPAPRFDFTGVSPRLGPVEAGHFELSEHAGGVAEWRWRASGRLPQVELARLAEEARPLRAARLRHGHVRRGRGAGRRRCARRSRSRATSISNAAARRSRDG